MAEDRILRNRRGQKTDDRIFTQIKKMLGKAAAKVAEKVDYLDGREFRAPLAPTPPCCRSIPYISRHF
jgi:hypothetical protein